METIIKTQTRTKHNGHNGSGRDTKDHIRTSKSHLKQAANELLTEGRKLVDEFYQDGLTKVGDAEESVKEYGDKVLKKAKQNPFASLCIAAGVGFVLSLLIRK